MQRVLTLSILLICLALPTAARQQGLAVRGKISQDRPSLEYRNVDLQQLPQWGAGPGNVGKYWLNVKDFGAKADGLSDDTPAVLGAIRAAGTGGRALVVYFPPSSGCYYLKSPLLLPRTLVWITLFFDGNVCLGETIHAVAGYVFHGNSGGQLTSFSRDNLTFFIPLMKGGDIIDIDNIAGFRLENIQFSEVYVDRGIVINNSAEIELKNVWLDAFHSDPTGIPVVIHGGFDIYVDGGGYGSSEDGTAPSMLITDDAAACDYSGVVRVRGAVFISHGVTVTATCGDINSLLFDDILYEDSMDPLVTIRKGNSWQNPMLWGMEIKDVNMADETIEARGTKPPLLRVLDQFRVYSISISNSWTDGYICKDGYPVSGLEIWSQVGCQVLGQSSAYVIVSPFGVIDTRVQLPPPQQPQSAVNAPAQLPAKLPSRSIRARSQAPN
jgi:hypothetical protein